ncbi:MAG: T9SS type A sorting domain-containing protein [candidate division KSB1 bacterium]|nr:T9SS type A sorting domain-containing protein [candidate division KSB1 bacterium]
MKNSIKVLILFCVCRSIVSLAAEAASSSAPLGYSLLPTYPNPFNSTTVIPYRLLENGAVRIEINDLLGRRIRRLIDEEQTAGEHRVVWNGRDDRGQEVPPGVYFCIMRFKDKESLQRMILIR